MEGFSPIMFADGLDISNYATAYMIVLQVS